MARGPLPDLIPLEDMNDLIDFLEATGRTVPRESWCEEIIHEIAYQKAEALF